VCISITIFCFNFKTKKINYLDFFLSRTRVEIRRNYGILKEGNYFLHPIIASCTDELFKILLCSYLLYFEKWCRMQRNLFFLFGGGLSCRGDGFSVVVDGPFAL